MIANPCCAQYRTLALRRRNGDASFSPFSLTNPCSRYIADLRIHMTIPP